MIISCLELSLTALERLSIFQSMAAVMVVVVLVVALLYPTRAWKQGFSREEIKPWPLCCVCFNGLTFIRRLFLSHPINGFRVFNLPVYFSSLLEIKVTRPLTFYTRFSNNIITMLDCPDHTEKSGKKVGQV